jgi:hypothetical protein
MNHVLTALQALGLLAVLVGLWLLLVLPVALIADGAIVLTAATATEILVRRTPQAGE